MRIYIAGKMTGIDDYNRPAFAYAARRLRDRGHVVFSPPESDKLCEASKRTDYYKKDFMLMLENNVDTIALLPGWEKSYGARLECQFGFGMGWHIYRIDYAYPSCLCFMMRRTDLDGITKD